MQISNHAGNFWDTVTNTYTIDLSTFDLPGCTSVEFSFMDPLYTWIAVCNDLVKRNIPLHWDPKILIHPDTGEAVYGGGIQYGKLLREACSSLSVQGKVALINVNWDGGGMGYGSRSCTPIHVQVCESLRATYVVLHRLSTWFVNCFLQYNTILYT